MELWRGSGVEDFARDPKRLDEAGQGKSEAAEAPWALAMPVGTWRSTSGHGWSSIDTGPLAEFCGRLRRRRFLKALAGRSSGGWQ